MLSQDTSHIEKNKKNKRNSYQGKTPHSIVPKMEQLSGYVKSDITG